MDATESLWQLRRGAKAAMEKRLGAAYRREFSLRLRWERPLQRQSINSSLRWPAVRTCRGPYCEIGMKQGGNTKRQLSSLKNQGRGLFLLEKCRAAPADNVTDSGGLQCN